MGVVAMVDRRCAWRMIGLAIAVGLLVSCSLDYVRHMNFSGWITDTRKKDRDHGGHVHAFTNIHASFNGRCLYLYDSVNRKGTTKCVPVLKFNAWYGDMRLAVTEIAAGIIGITLASLLADAVAIMIFGLLLI